MNDNYVLYQNIKSLDLHGLNRYQASIEIEGFILEQYMLKEKYVCIIHGIGSGIVRKACCDTLKKNKHVLGFKTDLFNRGVTIVELKNRK